MSKRLKEAADQLDTMAFDLRREAARSLREKGLTFAQIATELGISRQRAQQLCADESGEQTA